MFNDIEKNSFIKKRMAELFFAQGLPLIGIVSAGVTDPLPILFFLFCTLSAAVHILIYNDRCFDEAVGKVKANDNTLLLITFIIPLAGGLISGAYLALVIYLMAVINWNVYSSKGKYHFKRVVFHNFVGGFTHFTGGYFYGRGEDLAAGILTGLFFGLLMAGAGMHHDAVDYEEDRNAGYVTGAVKYGASKWWKYGLYCIAIAHILLFFLNNSFSSIMAVVFGFYLLGYITVLKLGIEHQNMKKFRIYCRVIYGLGGIIYLWTLVYG